MRTHRSSTLALVVAAGAALTGGLALTTPAAAVVAQTGSCVDGGGVTWSAKTTWGGPYVADGVSKASVDYAGWTTGRSGPTPTDSRVRAYEGDGRLTQELTWSGSFDYAVGTAYRVRNPRNPVSAPGRARVEITLGIKGDGRRDCTITFVQPNRMTTPTTPTPTPSPTPGPSTPSTPSGASGVAMPTTAKAGWTYSYGQDFNTPAAKGQFGTIYGKDWNGYVGTRNDTSKNGSYQPDKVLSVANSVLDMHLHHDPATGLYNVAAPFPQPPSGVNGGSQEYSGMRTTVRFRTTGPMPGYKVAWLLWPSTWDWNDGEIDFPEGSLDGTITGFSHQAGTGHPEVNQLAVGSPSRFDDGWHTATTEWLPGRSVEFFLDGVSLGKTTSNVASVPMHWTLQTETDLTSTPPGTGVSGHVEIDWLTVQTPAS